MGLLSFYVGPGLYYCYLKQQYLLIFLGTACGPPEEGFAECCFEDVPMFYNITVIDHETNDEMVSLGQPPEGVLPSI